ncbi:putative membrane protein [Congregibacter litoralis KT71]|uniref:Putative membrane protein n=2 Tax=Congregibacter TaxID=393661 RepID=A4A739_9GAMM|nr:putative membrane protein [Congregibacter litoralis KT71]
MNTSMDVVQRTLLLSGRALLGLYFIIPGITKITGFSGMVQYMTEHNVPLVQPLLVLTIVLQLGCGASLVAGWRTQIMAFVLAGLTLVISLYMHNFWAMEEGLQRAHEMQNFIKNMAIMAGLLYVAGVTPQKEA